MPRREFGSGSRSKTTTSCLDSTRMLVSSCLKPGSDARIVTESRKASISGVQRRLKIGYNRAARMIETMESAGLVGPLQSNGSREVLAPPPPDDD